MFQSEQIFNALSNVNLIKSNLLHGDVPCMQAANLAVKYEVNFNTNNEDSNGFRVVQAVYKEEAQVHGELHTLLEKGKEFVIMLYTWRSCSRALPTGSISGNNGELTNAIQEKTIEILKPYIDKLKKFKEFQNEAVKKFCEEINKLCKRRKREEFLSEANMLAMCDMLKIFVLIDEMKNMKAGMKNDHTQYKRAAQHLKILDNGDATDFSMYLAQQNVLRTNLKNELIKIPGFEDFFVELINLCVLMYNEKFYLYQEEKHTLVLVIAFSLYLMDTSPSPNINKIKKLSLPKIDQIIKECEVVNVFGDMSIYPFGFIKVTPNYDSSKWPENTNNKISTQGLIMNHISQFRSEYTSLTAELARYSNANVINQNEESKENNKSAYDLALKSLQLLSKWTTQIIDTFSWKLGHLADSHLNAEIPKEAEDYEKATKYNYDSQEKFALIEVIAMIKTIQTQLSRMECHFMETIIPYIYSEMQTFLHISLHEIFNKISKKTQLPFILQSLWAIGSDPKAFNELMIPISDKTNTISKKKGAAELLQCIENMKSQLKPRKIPPGSTQLYLIRCIVESLFQNKTKNKLRKEFDPQSLFVMEEFHKKSFFWSYLLNFADTLSISCDLSQLWYREFFLEMTNGKNIQFPIETSIPCILTNHILDTQDPAYIEYLLYPLDLYNDSAVCALKKFKRQFLYNEIEAEVNFMMIQLVVRLSDQIFIFYKQFASSMLLNKRFKKQINNSSKTNINYPPPERYVTLMKQRHLQLLGRSFNLCKLISYRINKSLYESLEAIIRRFQRNGLTSIMEFDSLITIHRLCHQNLSKYLELDDFDCVLAEITQSTTSTFGNVSEFIIKEITEIICPNFSFNSGTYRFVPMSESYRSKPIESSAHDRIDKLWGSKTLNSCFEIIMKLYNGYLGKEHIINICKYIGYDGIFWLISKLKNLCESLLKNNLKHYISLLMDQMPINLFARSSGKSAQDLVKIFNEELRKVIEIPNLTTEVSTALNTFGNCIIFVLQIENNLNISEALDIKQAYPFINIFPQPYSTSNEEMEKLKNKLNKKFSIYKINNVLDNVGTAEQVELSKQHWELTKERLCTENSIFKFFLNTLQEILYEMKTLDEDNVEINFWTRKENDAHYAIFDYEDSAFYMIWSTILYSFSKPDGKIKKNIDEVFGEGLQWAGCTILALLGQQRIFERNDICGKIMRASKSTTKENKADSELDLISKRIRCLLQTNSRIFDSLNRYLFTVDDYYIKPMIIHLNPNEPQNTPYDNTEEFDD